jgi:hypothetical protein
MNIPVYGERRKLPQEMEDAALRMTRSIPAWSWIRPTWSKAGKEPQLPSR